MFLYSKIDISKAAQGANFVRDSYEKLLRLVDTLSLFGNDEILSQYLLLKGGTAINLTLFALPRLSVDIDFDLAVNVAKEGVPEIREAICDKILKYMASGGYVQSAKSRLSYALDSFVFEYVNSASVKDNLKVEINYVLREHILDAETKDVLLCGVNESKQLKIKTVAVTEIFASKLVALVSRTAPRDLYDVFHAIKPGIFKDFLPLQNLFVFYSVLAAENFSELFNIRNVMNLKLYDIKRELLPMLRKGEHFELSVAQETVSEFLTVLFAFTKEQRKFLDSFAMGQYLPELLFEGVQLERAKQHPMALWKCAKNFGK